MTQIELFTSPTCPYCPGAKKVVHQVAGELNSRQQNSVKLFEYDTWEKEGEEKAREYGIMAVPSIFVSGSGLKQKILIEGAPSRQDLFQAIEIAEGKRSAEKPKGFWHKLLK